MFAPSRRGAIPPFQVMEVMRAAEARAAGFTANLAKGKFINRFRNNNRDKR